VTKVYGGWCAEGVEQAHVQHAAELLLLADWRGTLREALHEQRAILVAAHCASMTWVQEEGVDIADVINRDYVNGVEAHMKASPWALGAW